MAILHLRPVGGNDANDGLSFATAKQTHAGIKAIAVLNDTVLLYPSEGDINITPAAANEAFFGVGVYITIAPAEYNSYSYVYYDITRTSTNSVQFGNVPLSTNKVGFKIPYGSNTSQPINWVSGTTRRNIYYKSKWIITSSVNLTQFNVGANSGDAEFYEFDFDCNNITFTSSAMNFAGVGTKLYSGRIGNINHTGASQPTIVTNVGAVPMRFVSFYNIIKTQATSFFTPRAKVVNCSIELEAPANTYIFGIDNTADINCVLNNLIIRRGSNQFKVYGSSSAITVDSVYNSMIGYNAYYQCDLFNANITWTDKHLSDISLSDDGVITTNPASSDFMKPDNVNLINTGFPAGLNIGSIQQNTSASGETDPNKVLNTSTVISGNVIPVALSDVRSGVPAMLGTGTCAVPTAANVKNGVAVDATTGTLISTDPGVANVVAGIEYYVESVLKTGTRTAIWNLLNTNIVKIGEDRGDGSIGTYDASERYSEIDPALVVSGTAWRFNSLTNNRLGTRTAIYDLLNTNTVKINVDRGDGQLGTYVAAERYSNPGQSNVLKDVAYKFNSETDNQLGTSESTDPGESNVVLNVPYKINSVAKLGSRTAIYNLLSTSVVQSGVDRGDGQLGTDKGENFNTALTADKIAVGEVINSLGNEITGSYDASERYTDLAEDKVENLFEWRYNSLTNNRTGSLVGGSVDPKYILYPYGTLGEINTDAANIAAQIQASAETVISTSFQDPTAWSPLVYFKDITKNSYRNNDKQWGIRILGDIKTDEIIGRETIDLDYEIKLVRSFINRQSDQNERDVEKEMVAEMELIRRKLETTKFGGFSKVRIVRNWAREEINTYESDNILECRATITVNYRVK